MATERTELLRQLSDAVFELDEDRTKELSQKVLDKGFDAWEAVELGLPAGIQRAGSFSTKRSISFPNS